MFGIIADLIASCTTILLPAYLSYKSLRTGDPAQTTPWLIYFIILSLALLFESWTVFVLGWVPFYSWFRLFFLLYLVLPQTQGAKYLYLEYVEPYIVGHEKMIDEFIGEAHAKLQSIGLGYLAFVVDYIREKILGQASPQPVGAQSTPQPGTSGYTPQAAASYASDLLSRFSMPAARSTAASFSAPTPGASLASFFSSALSAQPTTQSYSATASRSVSNSHAQHGSTIPDLATLQSYISSPATSSAHKTELIQSQRERLTNLLKALDKEQQSVDLAYGASHARPSSSGSGFGSGLGPKSRSQQSFEQVSYEDAHTPASSHSGTPQSPPGGQGKRTTSGGWSGGWFGGSPGSKEKDDEGQDLASKGWSAARDMTEAVLSSGIDRRR